MKISAVINTWNEEDNIVDCIESIRSLVDEIVVVDMMSSDRTRELAALNGARVFEHEAIGYVEPARNYALAQANHEWILLLDADERLSESLAGQLRGIMERANIDYVMVPRQNMIFQKWIRHSGWWPDFNVRFFRNGSVVWKNEIHSQPETQGMGHQLDAVAGNALIHHHYRTISEYISRLDRYTKAQAADLTASGYRFDRRDLLRKPTNEFLRRYFAEEGFKDGLHGLILAFLQGISEFVLYLKIWEMEGFVEETVEMSELDAEIGNSFKSYWWWSSKHSGDKTKQVMQKVLSKFL